MSSSPRRYLGLTARELIIVLGGIVLMCTAAGAALWLISRAAPLVSNAVASVIPSGDAFADVPPREATRLPPTASRALTATFSPTPTSTPLPTATSTPSPGLSLARPLPPDSVFSLAGWEARVLEVKRGEAAAQAIRDANPFNAEAAPGREYLLVRLNVKSVHPDRESHRIRGGDFRLMGARRMEYLSGGVVVPDPTLDAELFTGGEIEGWVVFEIDRGEDLLILIWDLLDDTRSDRVYVALTAGAALPIDPQLDQIVPTDLGRTRDDPAPLGATVVTDDWLITALDAVRGDEAWRQIVAANRYNDPPAPGMEYVLVRVRARYIRPEETLVRIDSGWFKLIGVGNVLHDAPAIVEPTPALEARLFPGGEVEGWVGLQARAGETDLRLVFAPLFDRDQSQRRYLALPE
jgi:hypothetical protein